MEQRNIDMCEMYNCICKEIFLFEGLRLKYPLLFILILLEVRVRCGLFAEGCLPILVIFIYFRLFSTCFNAVLNVSRCAIRI